MHSLVLAETSDAAAGWLGGGLLFALVLALVAYGILVLIAGWKMYTKAGQPGWTSIIPLLNVLALLRIVQRPWWWIFLLMIPFVNVVFFVIIHLALARAFGKGVGMGLLLIFLTPIGYLVLGFGDAEYQWETDPIFS